MTKWEYCYLKEYKGHSVQVSILSFLETETEVLKASIFDVIADLGSKSWEMVNFQVGLTENAYWFKRPLP